MSKVSRKVLWHEYDKNSTSTFLTLHVLATCDMPGFPKSGQHTLLALSSQALSVSSFKWSANSAHPMVFLVAVEFCDAMRCDVHFFHGVRLKPVLQSLAAYDSQTAVGSRPYAICAVPTSLTHNHNSLAGSSRFKMLEPLSKRSLSCSARDG